MKKSELRQLIKEEVKAIQHDRETRRPTSAENKIATNFAKKKGATLDSIGVDDKSGKIYIEVRKKGVTVEFTLDNRGNIVDIELPF